MVFFVFHGKTGNITSLRSLTVARSSGTENPKEEIFVVLVEWDYRYLEGKVADVYGGKYDDDPRKPLTFEYDPES